MVKLVELGDIAASSSLSVKARRVIVLVAVWSSACGSYMWKRLPKCSPLTT